MKSTLIMLTAILPLLALSSTNALEMTAGGHTTTTANNGVIQRLNAGDAALQAVINQMLTCNNKGKIFKSDPSAAGQDADGCVSIAASSVDNLTVRQEAVSVNMPDLNYVEADYPGLKRNSKGWLGSASKSVSLQRFVDDGAMDFTISFSNAGFQSCNGGKSFTIENINQSTSQTYKCHYDKSPNRQHNLSLSYNADTKRVTYKATMSQVKSKRTDVSIQNIQVSYSALRVVERPSN